jgi:hypothetical protein
MCGHSPHIHLRKNKEHAAGAAFVWLSVRVSICATYYNQRRAALPSLAKAEEYPRHRFHGFI